MSELEAILRAEQRGFAPVIRFDPSREKLLALDLSGGNTALTPDVLDDTERFSQYINTALADASAVYGIGGYGEHRGIYSRSSLFGSEGSEEPRRLHLGTDIWGGPHTAVLAPLQGIVHSFANNNHVGDYGATIILSHQLRGLSFYTLYGHLSLNSIRNISGGDTIRRGEVLAEFGIPQENGQWPPHLHFQVISDMSGYEGDYPGVCKFSEKEIWLAQCPDPDLILQMNRYL